MYRAKYGEQSRVTCLNPRMKASLGEIHMITQIKTKGANGSLGVIDNRIRLVALTENYNRNRDSG